jgi:hypothetical protein
MPAAYTSVLDQLGVGREVGLWLATRLNACEPHAGWSGRWLLNVVVVMRD